MAFQQAASRAPEGAAIAPEVTAAIISAAALVLVAVAGAALSRYFDRRQQIEQELRQRKAAVYSEFLDYWFWAMSYRSKVSQKEREKRTVNTVPPCHNSLSCGGERLQALRAEQRQHEAALQAAQDDPDATKRSISKLRSKVAHSAAEVTALMTQEKREYAKSRDARLRSYRRAKAAHGSSVRRREEALREQHQDRMRWHRRIQIVERVQRDVRRAFKFGAAWPNRRLPWRLLPPGEFTIERLRHHYKGVQHRNPHVRYDVERLEKAFSLESEACYIGTDEFEGYVVFTFARTERALLECPVYGNAIYVLGPDWRRLSKLSKQELLSGRPGGVTKIVHTGNWFRRARLALGIR